MKKMIFWLFAIPLLSIVLLNSSCKKDDDSPTVIPVEGITFTQMGSNIMIQWDAVPGAKSYMVSTGGIAVSDLPIAGTSYVVGLLVDGVEIKIEAFSDSQMNSLIAMGKVNFEKPSSDLVTNITFTEMGSDVIVSWDPVVDARSYMVSKGGIPCSEIPIVGTYFNVGSLSDGIQIKVEAFSDSQAAQLIATGVAEYHSQQVGTIQNLNLATISGQVHITWDYFQGAQYYMVLVNGQMMMTTPISFNNWTVQSMSSGSVVRVEAYTDAAMNTLAALAEAVYEGSGETRPDPVYGLYEIATGSNYTQLGWNNPDSERTSIEIYDGQRVEGYVGNRIKQLDAYSEMTLLQNLNSGETYTFYVYVVNENNSTDETRYSDGSPIVITTEAEAVNLNGTVWYNPGSNLFPVTMTLTFHANTVDWVEGDYTHNGLDYSFNGLTLTGIIDDGGYYEGNFEVDEDVSTLTFMGDFHFVRIQ